MSQQEGPDLSAEEVAALRKVARDKYVGEREEQQMHLYKKILDDQKKLFLPGKQDEGTLIDEIYKRIGKGEQGSLNKGLSEIEKRRIEIDEKLYALANKYREAYKDQKEAAEGYQMPDAYDDRADKKVPDRTAVLHKRYEEEKTNLTEQEMWELDRQRTAVVRFGAKNKSKE